MFSHSWLLIALGLLPQISAIGAEHPPFLEAYEFKQGLADVVLSLKPWRTAFINTQGIVVLKLDPGDSATLGFDEGLAAVRRNNKCGFIDIAGTFLIPMKYDDCFNFSEDLAPVKQDGKWGFINKANHFVIAPQYDQAYQFAEGVAPVQKGNRWGFIDKTGKVAIGFLFDEIRSKGSPDVPVIATAYWHGNFFSDGLAAVSLRNLWGFINHEGKVIIPPTYDTVSQFHEGFAAARQGKRILLIDPLGKIFFEEGKTRYCARYSDGYCTAPDDPKSMSFSYTEPYVVLDKTGAVLLRHTGFLGVLTGGLFSFRAGDLWGAMNLQGNVVIAPRFKQLHRLSENLLAAQSDKGFGYIDKKGNWVITP